MIAVYDLEQFQNFHSCFAVDVNSRQEFYFEISDFRDDRYEYYEWLKQLHGMIGFNCLNYDYPLLEWFIKLKNEPASELCRKLFPIGQKLISNRNNYRKRILIPQCDLFKIMHFDNLAKITSLKDLQVAMKWHNVQDLPFRFDHRISKDEAEEVKFYNRNDTLSTLEFYLKIKDKINLRNTLQDRYGIPCLNYNDPKIGEEILLKLVSEKKGVNPYWLRNQRTERDRIVVKECLLPYEYATDEVKEVRSYFEDLIITETKGAIKKSIIHDGLKYDFGTGGIHGCKPAGIWESDDEYVLMDSDVESYYPRLAIQYGFYPMHLGPEYIEVYDRIFQDRKKGKKEGDVAADKGLKLGLNGAYGKSNDKYSFLYDPKYTMTTTINGQLMLTDLAIELQKEGYEIIFINTDGFMFKIPISEAERYSEICNNWMKKTKLNLEHEICEKIAIRDVNNYTAKFANGEIKEKGAFEVDKDWHKDPSFRIVPLAIKKYVFDGIRPEEFIPKHDDIFDFCGRVKSNSGYEIRLHELDGGSEKITKLQKTNRVYVSNKGGSLYKVKGDRVSAVYKGQKVTLFNQFFESGNYDINYQWYIRETRKIIDVLEPKQLTLF